MKISIISAIAENKVIGNKNRLPWHLPADFKWFKERTMGKTIVMGLNTFKSINEKALPNRKTIVLTKDLNYKTPEGCLSAQSIDQVLETCKNDQELMICGGASIYAQFLPLTDRLYLTFIHQSFEGDTYFPAFNINDWQEVIREDCEADEKNPYSYSFVILDRK